MFRLLMSFRSLAKRMGIGLILSLSAFAVERVPGLPYGSFDSPRQTLETCSVPRALDLSMGLEQGGTLAYAPLSGDQTSQARNLCALDFYDGRGSLRGESAYVTCPKLNSTNPGLMIHELPLGVSRESFERSECSKVRGRSGRLVAKYKQSTSCSYTPSILAYPRIAQALGSEIELPFSVYRSMDRLEHLGRAEDAKELAARVAGYGSLIAQTWRGLYETSLTSSDFSTAVKKQKRLALFSDFERGNFKLIYGALVPEISGDEIYWEANGSARGDRLANFQQTAAFRALTDPRPVSTAISIQSLLLLREMGDLVVLDTLLSQQDRFGNLHFREFFFKLNPDGKSSWIEASRADARALQSQGYVRVKRMLLNDNDCGVAKENKMASARIAQKVSHLHPSTYLGVRKLRTLVSQDPATGKWTGALVSYLKSDLLFTENDTQKFARNLDEIARSFKERCLAGQLFLDADPVQHRGFRERIESATFCRENL